MGHAGQSPTPQNANQRVPLSLGAGGGTATNGSRGAADEKTDNDEHDSSALEAAGLPDKAAGITTASAPLSGAQLDNFQSGIKLASQGLARPKPANSSLEN